MRVLFDIVHPAHVHFYRHLHDRLRTEGHEVRVLARDKDVTCDLLRAFGMPFETYGEPRSGLVGQARELVGRDRALWRIARQLRPDVILARNPAGMHVARLTGAKGIFDTDNGTSAGIHFTMARPFAHIITTPACMTEDFGKKHRRFEGYKPLAFLHPNHFTPDPSVRDELGVGPDEPFAIVRIVAMDASHDHGERGVDVALLDDVVQRLDGRVRVFLSAEGELPTHLSHLQAPIAPHRMHDALAEAAIVVGDSGSMAVEAAVLGTPNAFYGSFAGRLEYLNDLEERYSLARSFRPDETTAFLDALEAMSDPDEKQRWAERRQRMLTEVVDVSEWYQDLVEEVVAARHAGRS